MRLEGESQCITLHLLPVCDIIGQTHILHIHYFLCVFSQSNGINCTFACRNLFITYNYIEHGTFCTVIHFGYFSSYLLVFLFLPYGMRISELKNGRLRYSWVLKCSKGQIISKGLFGVLEFSQKTNERILRSSNN